MSCVYFSPPSDQECGLHYIFFPFAKTHFCKLGQFLSKYFSEFTKPRTQMTKKKPYISYKMKHCNQN